MHVLVMGGEANARHVLARHLEYDGYEVSEAPLGEQALTRLHDRWPDLILLAQSGHDTTMIRWCHQLRRHAAMPIIVLLGSNPGTLVVRALRAGADDVLCQPFSLAELSARIRAVLRRARGDADGVAVRYVDERLSIDLAKRRVAVEGRVVRLSPTEFRLLSCLVQRRGRIVSHQEAIVAVWGEGDLSTHGKQLSLYVGYLRRKLELDPRNPRYIRTKYGQGYWFGSPHASEP